MARTGKMNIAPDPKANDLLVRQIEQLVEQLNQKLKQFETQNGSPFGLEIVDIDENEEETPVVDENSQTKEVDNYDYINPQHYVQDDGRQTWERMLGHWSLEQVALWCEMTVFKYEDRKGKKPNEDPEREQKKIEWYKNKAVELRQKAKNEKKSGFFSFNS